jgi:hypothetical protein
MCKCEEGMLVIYITQTIKDRVRSFVTDSTEWNIA